MNPTTWIEKFAFELGSRGFASDDISAAVVETENHIAESKCNPLDQFGLPADYAAHLAQTLDTRRQDTDTGQPPVLVAENISKSFGSTAVLQDLSLSLPKGKIVALIGPNGAGKTTFLKIAAGLLSPDKGDVSGTDQIGYCPQTNGVHPYLRPTEHFELVGAGLGLPKHQAIQEGNRLAEQLAWVPPAKTVASELSGGTAQKLSLILAMLGQPDPLLLDEPYQGFDTKSSQRFWEMLWDWRDNGGSVVVSSHVEDVLVRADTIVELEPTG